MAIFHSYVKLPEGKRIFPPKVPISYANITAFFTAGSTWCGWPGWEGKLFGESKIWKIWHPKRRMQLGAFLNQGYRIHVPVYSSFHIYIYNYIYIYTYYTSLYIYIYMYVCMYVCTKDRLFRELFAKQEVALQITSHSSWARDEGGLVNVYSLRTGTWPIL